MASAGKSKYFFNYFNINIFKYINIYNSLSRLVLIKSQAGFTTAIMGTAIRKTNLGIMAGQLRPPETHRTSRPHGAPVSEKSSTLRFKSKHIAKIFLTLIKIFFRVGWKIFILKNIFKIFSEGAEKYLFWKIFSEYFLDRISPILTIGMERSTEGWTMLEKGSTVLRPRMVYFLLCYLWGAVWRKWLRDRRDLQSKTDLVWKDLSLIWKISHHFDSS